MVGNWITRIITQAEKIKTAIKKRAVGITSGIVSKSSIETIVRSLIQPASNFT